MFDRNVPSTKSQNTIARAAEISIPPAISNTNFGSNDDGVRDGL